MQKNTVKLMASHPKLEFVNGRLTGTLEIEFDVPDSPSARIVGVKLRPSIYNSDTNEYRPLTPEELGAVAFSGSSIRLRSDCGGEAISHDAPNGSCFTVAEML